MSIDYITPEEAMELVTSGQALLIDVREQEEFNHIRIPDAAFLPMSATQYVAENLPEHEGDTLIFFCKAGGRSQRAAEELENSGYEDKEIFNLEGGIIAWMEENLPTESEQAA